MSPMLRRPGVHSAITRDAFLLVDRHGALAPLILARRIDNLMGRGDVVSVLGSVAILRAVQALLAPAPGGAGAR